MKRIKSLIVVVVIIAAALLYANIGKNNLAYDKNIDSSKYIATGSINRIEQIFVSQEKTLDGFRAKCQSIGNVQGMKINYSLVDAKTNEVLATGVADATEIKNSKYYYFKFDTVKIKDGKAYKVVLENTSADENNGIGFFFQPQTEKGTTLTVKGVDTTGTMIIKAVTQRFDLETFVVLLVFVLYVVVFIKFLYKLFR